MLMIWLDLQDMNNAPPQASLPGIGRTWLETCRNQQTKKISPSDLFLVWLGLQDSNLRMTGPKPVALPLGEGPTMSKF